MEFQNLYATVSADEDTRGRGAQEHSLFSRCVMRGTELRQDARVRHSHALVVVGTESPYLAITFN